MAEEVGGIALECDVSSEEQGEAAVRAARETHGPARISVCCAGIAESRLMVGKDGPAPLAHHTRIVNVHLVGTYNICRLAAADMADCEPVPETGERGVLINTASIAGFDGPPGAVTYDAVKMTKGRPVEKKRFEASENVFAPEPGPVGEGLNKAANRVAGDVAEWVG